MNVYYEQTFGGRVRFWTGSMSVEHSALTQLRNIASLPILSGHVAVMPDVHMGKGATVGSVIPTVGAVIPSAVGVDIGCGMVAVKTTLRANDLPDSLSIIRSTIEKRVPVGFGCHPSEPTLRHLGAAGHVLQIRKHKLLERFSDLRIMGRVKSFDEGRMNGQVGSLGGGNHFIELCLDDGGDVWIMLHSGSRNVGKTIGEAAMESAREQAKIRGDHLPDRDLAWLADGTPEFDEYVDALSWAQEYAALNRDTMLALVSQAVKEGMGHDFGFTDSAINCHHNYLSREIHGGQSMWVTRKGAVSAMAGQMGIIPGSMGTKSFIVCGKGHEAAYCSCSHGAGRKMSRSQAKREFTEVDLSNQTAGVECRKDAGVVDEIPAAYKDIDEVMLAQADLVEIRHTLKQVLCVKG